MGEKIKQAINWAKVVFSLGIIVALLVALMSFWKLNFIDLQTDRPDNFRLFAVAMTLVVFFCFALSLFLTFGLVKATRIKADRCASVAEEI